MSTKQEIAPQELRDRYVDLLCRSLTRYEMETATVHVPVNPSSAPSYLRRPLGITQTVLRKAHLDLAHVRRPALADRADGIDWPVAAETMVGLKRLHNLRDCLQTVFAEQVPGDILEAGVWRGGASIFMRGVAVAYGEAHRRSWVADSFEGLPPPEAKYSADGGADFHLVDSLAVSLEEVRHNFEKYDLFDEHNVHFLKGWFRDTFTDAPIEKLALLRLDGDMYSSTIETLRPLYDRVSPGGFVVVDDYNWIDSCKQATDDFRKERGIHEQIVSIDSHGVYWRKRTT